MFLKVKGQNKDDAETFVNLDQVVWFGDWVEVIRKDGKPTGNLVKGVQICFNGVEGEQVYAPAIYSITTTIEFEKKLRDLGRVA